MKLIDRLKMWAQPRRKRGFLNRFAPYKVLDVGCGNNSPYIAKSILPQCHYTGLDIADYNQTKPNMADNYILTSPDEWASAIAEMANQFDAVISSHNLEHCADRWETLEAMVKALKQGGVLYLAFPCEQSVNFPKRKGTLNYYDDASHTGVPPSAEKVINILRDNKMEILYFKKRYRTLFTWVIGFLVEPLSAARCKLMYGTWGLYGFETIVWAKKYDDCR